MIASYSITTTILPDIIQLWCSPLRYKSMVEVVVVVGSMIVSSTATERIIYDGMTIVDYSRKTRLSFASGRKHMRQRILIEKPIGKAAARTQDAIILLLLVAAITDHLLLTPDSDRAAASSSPADDCDACGLHVAKNNNNDLSICLSSSCFFFASCFFLPIRLVVSDGSQKSQCSK